MTTDAEHPADSAPWRRPPPEDDADAPFRRSMADLSRHLSERAALHAPPALPPPGGSPQPRLRKERNDAERPPREPGLLRRVLSIVAFGSALIAAGCIFALVAT